VKPLAGAWPWLVTTLALVCALGAAPGAAAPVDLGTESTGASPASAPDGRPARKGAEPDRPTGQRNLDMLLELQGQGNRPELKEPALRLGARAASSVAAAARAAAPSPGVGAMANEPAVLATEAPGLQRAERGWTPPPAGLGVGTAIGGAVGQSGGLAVRDEVGGRGDDTASIAPGGNLSGVGEQRSWFSMMPMAVRQFVREHRDELLVALVLAGLMAWGLKVYSRRP
jgi:hypothetical protein